jgi:Ribbon-helix-helix protein, copG family
MTKEEIQLDLTEEEMNIIKSIAKQNNVSPDEIIEQMLREYLEEIENPLL